MSRAHKDRIDPLAQAAQASQWLRQTAAAWLQVVIDTLVLVLLAVTLTVALAPLVAAALYLRHAIDGYTVFVVIFGAPMALWVRALSPDAADQRETIG
jgi:ABC-type sugar transport system permease subunit